MSRESGPEYYDLSLAEVSEDKVKTYLLNLLHPDGGPKAKFFWARGFNNVQWEALADALRDQGLRNPVEKLETTPYGTKVAIRCRMESPDGLNPCILTVWMHAQGGVPKLVTAYPG